MSLENATHLFNENLGPRPANFVPLSPLTFIERAASVHPQRIAVVDGERRFTWHETFERCRRLASALQQMGIGLGDTVSFLAPNVPAIYEAHFGVPAAGAVLNTINTRLDARAIAHILEHSETKLLVVDEPLGDLADEALDQIGREMPIVEIYDTPSSHTERPGRSDWESFLTSGSEDFAWTMPTDEWQAITLNYTSGTTGKPKGVIFHHRGAYLNALGNALSWGMQAHPVYLWTVPMFHCNGWCFAWTLAALAGTNICMRNVGPAAIYQALADHQVTHLCGAPIVLGMLINAADDERRSLEHPVQVMTAGAPPPAAVLEKAEAAGFEVTHAYGLTEVYGPVVFCEWRKEWDALPSQERAALKARQGVRYVTHEALTVADPDTLAPVPADGQTMGEIMLRGNTTMKGYLKDPAATADAFSGGWFHSGDLGVLHPDGYIEIKDRSKDIIISGGENISSVEVEGVLYAHPGVLEAAVVARPDNKWGETPCAFVCLKDGVITTEADVIDYCRANLAHYKCPKTVVFGQLPKTATGKIQKFLLRERARALESSM